MMRLNSDEFETAYAARWELTVDCVRWLGLRPEPCSCGLDVFHGARNQCDGWRMAGHARLGYVFATSVPYVPWRYVWACGMTAVVEGDGLPLLCHSHGEISEYTTKVTDIASLDHYERSLSGAA